MGAAVVALALGAGGAGVAAGTAIDVAAIAAVGVAYGGSNLWGSAPVSVAPPHAPSITDEDFSLPEYLSDAGYESTINVGFFGASGAGKSTLINTIRCLKSNMDGAAPVGAQETTMTPTQYSYADAVRVRLWDMPGAGTAKFPRDSYIRDMGLRFYDAVVLVTSTRVTEIDRSIVAALRQYDVPCFVVRTKIDVDVTNEMEDNGLSEATTRNMIHDELKMSLMGVSDAYLVSKRSDEPEIQRLRASMLACIMVKRRDHEESDCPVCFEPFTIIGDKEALCCSRCRNRVCKSCIELMRSRQTGTLECPFCRSLFSDGGESKYRSNLSSSCPWSMA